VKRTEITDLLRHAARVDRWIEPGSPEVIEGWFALIGADEWITYELALDALRAHYRAGNRTVMPHDILSNAGQIAGERLMLTAVPLAVIELAEEAATRAGTGGGAAFHAVMTAARSAIVSGENPVPAAEFACNELAQAAIGGPRQ
jgi:hypothetical protein